MSKKKLIPVTIGIVYDPELVDQGEMVNMFDGHDGGGYCFLDGMRDEVFFTKLNRKGLSNVRATCRKLRRRKGIEAADVSIDVEDDSL